MLCGQIQSRQSSNRGTIPSQCLAELSALANKLNGQRYSLLSRVIPFHLYWKTKGALSVLVLIHHQPPQFQSRRYLFTWDAIEDWFCSWKSKVNDREWEAGQWKIHWDWDWVEKCGDRGSFVAFSDSNSNSILCSVPDIDLKWLH